MHWCRSRRVPCSHAVLPRPSRQLQHLTNRSCNHGRDETSAKGSGSTSEEGSVSFFQARSEEALLEEARPGRDDIAQGHGACPVPRGCGPRAERRVFPKETPQFLTPALRATLSDVAGLVRWFDIASCMGKDRQALSRTRYLGHAAVLYAETACVVAYGLPRRVLRLTEFPTNHVRGT